MLTRMIVFLLCLGSLGAAGRGVVMMFTADAKSGTGSLPAARVGRSSRPRVQMNWGQLVGGVVHLVLAGPAAVLTAGLFLVLAVWSGESEGTIVAECLVCLSLTAFVVLRRGRAL